MKSLFAAVLISSVSWNAIPSNTLVTQGSLSTSSQGILLSQINQTETGADIQSVALSPDGTRLLMLAEDQLLTGSARLTEQNRRLVKATTGPEVRLAHPHWSATGARIAWFEHEGANAALTVMDEARDTHLRLPLPAHVAYQEPAWAPNDEKLAFSDNRGYLWLADVNKGSLLVIAHLKHVSPAARFHPQWSPDGRWLSYTGQSQSGKRALYLYSVERKHAYRLPIRDRHVSQTAWSPRGDRIYFVAAESSALQVEGPNPERTVMPNTLLALDLTVSNRLPGTFLSAPTTHTRIMWRNIADRVSILSSGWDGVTDLHTLNQGGVMFLGSKNSRQFLVTQRGNSVSQELVGSEVRNIQVQRNTVLMQLDLGWQVRGQAPDLRLLAAAQD